MKDQHERGWLPRLFCATAFAFAYVGNAAAMPIQNPRTSTPGASNNGPATRQHPITFPDILSIYAQTNMGADRQHVLSMYLRSQSATYEKYMAEKKVGVDTSVLENSAAAEIASKGQLARDSVYSVRIHANALTYSRSLGGIPISSPDADSYCVEVPNRDTPLVADYSGRTYKGDWAPGDGPVHMPTSWGFADAHVCIVTLGWVVPATPAQAANIFESMGVDHTRGALLVRIQYTVDLCKYMQPPGGDWGLWCNATAKSIWGLHPNGTPYVQYVKR